MAPCLPASPQEEHGLDDLPDVLIMVAADGAGTAVRSPTGPPGQVPAASPAADPAAVYRLLYVRAADPECLALSGRMVEALRDELRGGAPGDQRQDPPADLLPRDGLRHEATAWAAQETQRYRTLLDKAGNEEARLALVRRAVLGCAPLGLRAGAWLQWLSCPADADDPLVLAVLARYASDVGVNRPRQSRGDVYLTLMRGLDLADQATPIERLASDRSIAHEAFHLPAVMIALGRRPDVFASEVLGADECLRAVGLLPAVSLVREALPHAAADRALDLSLTRLSEPGVPDSSEPPIAEFSASQAAAAADGFRWALRVLRVWSDLLYDELTAACDPAFEMAELVRLRGREAAVYHHAYPLAGTTLSELMAEGSGDPAPLLAALASSRLVAPGRADRSPLLGRLIADGGPMFRIFPPRDQAVIRRWINALNAPPPSPAPDGLGGVQSGMASGASPHRDTAAPTAQRLRDALDTAFTAGADEPGGSDSRPENLREAYQALQARAHGPRLRAFAADYTRDWLAESARGPDRPGTLPAGRWDSQDLKEWLGAQHELRGQEFDSAADGPVPGRDALIDDTVQLAPLTLIDGGWLRGFTDYGHASTESGYSLFATYWDELGNGRSPLNHPLIYREVLAEMGVTLPPTGSAGFAAWKGFRDGSFALPVYWLSIGSLPGTFLPEILGLNLAMELSGVGGGYRKAAIALKAHGFSTRFVDIHNTIDNVATGHSAWAADAIAAYLAQIAQLQGHAAQEAAWSRVRVGYRSLNPPNPPRRAGRPHGRRPSWMKGNRQ
jgi:Iron-containing redox enzyme